MCWVLLLAATEHRWSSLRAQLQLDWIAVSFWICKAPLLKFLIKVGSVHVDVEARIKFIKVLKKYTVHVIKIIIKIKKIFKKSEVPSFALQCHIWSFCWKTLQTQFIVTDRVRGKPATSDVNILKRIMFLKKGHEQSEQLSDPVFAPCDSLPKY